MKGIGAIPIFVAVVESGGFSLAARNLGVSKSAISKRINQLEDDLGVRLLHRTTRKLSLTEAGERYFDHAKIALKAACEAEDAVTELQGEPSGKLKVCSPMSFGRLHVAPLIPKLLKRFPKLDVELLMDDRQVDLVSEGIDIAIRSSAAALPDSSLIARKLAPLRQAIYATPDYLANTSYPQAPSDLIQHNCVLFSYSQDGNIWTFEHQKEKCTVEVAGNYRVNNSEAILSAVLEGVGVGRLPTFIAGEYEKSGQLIRLLPQYQIPDHVFFAVFPERQYLPAKVRAFLEFAVEFYGEDNPYWDR